MTAELVITVDLERSGIPEGSGLDREVVTSIVRKALFFTPLSYRIEDEVVG